MFHETLQNEEMQSETMQMTQSYWDLPDSHIEHFRGA